MTDYYTPDELARMGVTLEPLYIGTHEALQAFGATGAPFSKPTPTKPSVEDIRAQGVRHRRAHGVGPRTYRSRFVGVTRHRDRWVAQWGERGRTKGKSFPMDADGELAAAWERARALGLSSPEERPEGSVRTDAPDVRPINPRGVGAKAARGRRIA